MLLFLLLAASAIGIAVANGQLLLAILPLAAISLVWLLGAETTTIVGAALAMSWLSKFGSSLGLFPRILEFADIPLAWSALALAAWRRSRRPEVSSPLASAYLRSLGLLAAAVCASWLTNPSEPLRPIAALALMAAPFALLVAPILDRPTRGGARRLKLWILALIAIQVPLSLYQAASHGPGDFVQGSLVGAGAGAHVMAGGVALYCLYLAASSPSRILQAVAISVAAGVCLLALANQVLFVLPIGVLLVFMFPSLRGRRRGRTDPGATSSGSGALRLLGAATALLVAAIVLSRFGVFNSSLYLISLNQREGGGKQAVIDSLVQQYSHRKPSLVFGLGPGETVSRFAYLTTPALLKSGSPVEALGLHAGRYTATLDAQTNRWEFGGGSSGLEGQSSAIGLIGDYGVVGIVAYAALVARIIRDLLRSEGSAAAASVAGWAMLIPLALIFDWAEQPPFMLLLAALTGLALSEHRPDVNVTPPLPLRRSSPQGSDDRRPARLAP